jgi:hypothetical protein
MSKTADGAIAPMQGAGFYNKNSSLQAAGISMIRPPLRWRSAKTSRW